MCGSICVVLVLFSNERALRFGFQRTLVSDGVIDALKNEGLCYPIFFKILDCLHIKI